MILELTDKVTYKLSVSFPWCYFWFITSIYYGLQSFQIYMLKSLECDLIWRQGLYWSNQVKRWPLRWVLIQYDWCLYKEGKFGHRDIYGRKTMLRDTGRRWPSINQVEKPVTDPSITALKEPALLTSWFQTSSLWKYEKINFCGLIYLIRGTLLEQP